MPRLLPVMALPRITALASWTQEMPVPLFSMVLPFDGRPSTLEADDAILVSGNGVSGYHGTGKLLAEDSELPFLDQVPLDGVAAVHLGQNDPPAVVF